MPTSEEPIRTGPSPRTLLIFLAVVMASQAVYAGIEIFGRVEEAGASATPLRLVVSAGYIVYVAMVVAFVYAIWREGWWAWHLAVAIAATGLVLAGLRILGGDTVEQHGLGMIIDAALLFYLQRPSIKGLFGR